MSHIPEVLQFLEFAISTVIGYLMWRMRVEALLSGKVTAAKFDTVIGQNETVIDQTNGMSQHLVSLQKVVSHAEGVRDERARRSDDPAGDAPAGATLSANTAAVSANTAAVSANTEAAGGHIHADRP